MKKVNVNVNVTVESANDAAKTVVGSKITRNTPVQKDCLKVADRLMKRADTAVASDNSGPKSIPFYLDDSMTEKERKAATKKAVRKATDCWKYFLVPTGVMAIDTYHRNPLDLENYKKSIQMERDFDREKFTPVTLSYRDGILWIVDGAREVLAAIRTGVTMIPANILFDKSFEVEAESFEKQDENKIGVSPMQLYRSKVARKDETACRIEKLCDQLGITVTSRGRDAERPLRAIATVMNIAETMSPHAIAWIFTAMDKAEWLNDRTCLTRALTGRFIRAFANVYAESERNGRVNAYLCKLVNVLWHMDPAMVEAYAKLQKPFMNPTGYLTVVLKDIAKGNLTADDIYALVNDNDDI